MNSRNLRSSDSIFLSSSVLNVFTLLPRLYSADFEFLGEVYKLFGETFFDEVFLWTELSRFGSTTSNVYIFYITTIPLSAGGASSLPF
jgi:hypothetical protein